MVDIVLCVMTVIFFSVLIAVAIAELRYICNCEKRAKAIYALEMSECLNDLLKAFKAEAAEKTKKQATAKKNVKK